MSRPVGLASFPLLWVVNRGSSSARWGNRCAGAMWLINDGTCKLRWGRGRRPEHWTCSYSLIPFSLCLLLDNSWLLLYNPKSVCHYTASSHSCNPRGYMTRFPFYVWRRSEFPESRCFPGGPTANVKSPDLKPCKVDCSLRRCQNCLVFPCDCRGQIWPCSNPAPTPPFLKTLQNFSSVFCLHPFTWSCLWDL